MYLTSVTKLKLNKHQFTVIDSMSYRAKALYNSSLYEIDNHFKNTKEYTRYEHADVLFWTEIEDIEQLKFNVKHYTEILRYIIDENGNKQYFVIHPELLNSTLGQYVVHLENKLKENGIA